MKESYKMSNSEETRIKELLSSLPQYEAPSNFEEKLLNNIRRIENGENVSLIRTNKRNWLVPSLSTAAGFACAFALFNLFDSAPAPIQTQQQMATAPIEVKADSTKEIPTTSSQRLNLVKDKK